MQQDSCDDAITIFNDIIDTIVAKFDDGKQREKIRELGTTILDKIREGKAHEPEQIMNIFDEWISKLLNRNPSKGSLAIFNSGDLDVLLTSFQNLSFQASLFSYLLAPHNYMCIDARPYKPLNNPVLLQPLEKSIPVPPPPPLPSKEERAKMYMELVNERVEELGEAPVDDKTISKLCVTDETLRIRIGRYVDNSVE